jgi:predicted lipid-binding transport protein (Tim44 family)
MFAELKMELAGRGAAVQKTEVIRVNAEVTGVEESADRYWVSVRFTGAMRDDIHAPEESFDEVWHLTKPRQGDSGWLLSGIQQAA